MSGNIYLGMFTERQIESRFDDLFAQAQAYVDEFNKLHGGSLFLDPGLLKIAVVSTYIDIARYKKFHIGGAKGSKLGACKRAAYVTKWVSRIKPIYPNWSDSVLIRVRKAKVAPREYLKMAQSPYAVVNEQFGISYAVNSINDELEKEKQKFKVSLSEGKAFQLIYDLYYREMSDDAILTLYETLKEQAMMCNDSKKCPRE